MKTSLRQVSVFLLVAVVVMQSTGLLFSVMGVPSATFTITSGVYPGAPSYTVWNETGTIYAKNANGFIEYSGTNASEIIQSALDIIEVTNYHTLTTKGGILFLREGLYVIDTTLLIGSFTTLQGSGWMYVDDPLKNNAYWKGTVLKLADNADVTMIRNKNTTKDFCITIQDLTLEGNKAQQTATNIDGIQFNETQDSIIQRVFFNDIKRHAIFLHNGQGPNYIIKNEGMNIDGSAIYNEGTDTRVTQNVMTSTGSVYKSTISSNSVIDNDFFLSANYGIEQIGAENNRFENNRISYNQKDGMKIDGGQGNIVSGNIAWGNGYLHAGSGYSGFSIASSFSSISDNVAYDADFVAGTQDYGMILGSARNNTLSGNTLSKNHVRGLQMDNADFNVIVGLTTSQNVGDYGIYIVATSEYNILIGISAFNNPTANILNLGSNNEIHNSYNGTSWVA